MKEIKSNEVFKDYMPVYKKCLELKSEILKHISCMIPDGKLNIMVNNKYEDVIISELWNTNDKRIVCEITDSIKIGFTDSTEKFKYYDILKFNYVDGIYFTLKAIEESLEKELIIYNICEIQKSNECYLKLQTLNLYQLKIILKSLKQIASKKD